jgi:hypothetical protein
MQGRICLITPASVSGSLETTGASSSYFALPEVLLQHQIAAYEIVLGVQGAPTIGRGDRSLDSS